jgi:hypothetical protein
MDVNGNYAPIFEWADTTVYGYIRDINGDIVIGTTICAWLTPVMFVGLPLAYRAVGHQKPILDDPKSPEFLPATRGNTPLRDQ